MEYSCKNSVILAQFLCFLSGSMNLHVLREFSARPAGSTASRWLRISVGKKPAFIRKVQPPAFTGFNQQHVTSCYYAK